MCFLLFQVQREIALVFVQFTDFRHFFMGQGKVEDVDVLRQVCWIGGFRENYVAFLDVPAQDDLGICPAVLLRQAGKSGSFSSPASPCPKGYQLSMTVP